MKWFCFEDHDAVAGDTLRNESDGIWCSASTEGWHTWGKWGMNDYETPVIFGYKADVTPVLIDRFLQERQCETCGLIQQRLADGTNVPVSRKD